MALIMRDLVYWLLKSYYCFVFEMWSFYLSVYVSLHDLIMWLWFKNPHCGLFLFMEFIRPCKVCAFVLVFVLQRSHPPLAVITRPSAPCAMLPMPEILLTSLGLMRSVAAQSPMTRFDVWGNFFFSWLMCSLIFPQDANVRLIRELREEIDRLKSMLLSFEMVWNPFFVGGWR